MYLHNIADLSRYIVRSSQLRMKSTLTNSLQNHLGILQISQVMQRQHWLTVWSFFFRNDRMKAMNLKYRQQPIMTILFGPTD